MDFPHSDEQVAQYISNLLRADLRSDEVSWHFKFKGAGSGKEFVLAKARLESLTSTIRQKELSDETGLYSDTSFEILVNEEGPFPGRRLREETLTVHDSENGFTYEITTASDEYLLWLIATASGKGTLRDLGMGFLSPIGRMRLDRAFADGEASNDALDIVRLSSARSLTLRIQSASKVSLKRFHSAATSFLFHLAYNMDVALVPQRFFEELSRRGRISRMRRSKASELDPPRRTYNEDLVSHYLLAISTDSPTIQFLSYYHVIEHFFESVFNDDLIEHIKSTITQPSFSYKRKKDIGLLIGTIKRSLQIRSETITFSEPEALRLVLGKFVDVHELMTRIDEYDPSLVAYYETTEVPFSKGCIAKLRTSEADQCVRELARRIYATRNALVHSKDGEKARYIPFKDERALIKEIPLMRFVSEAIILSVSDTN